MPALDGLRGLAVLAVVLYHAGLAAVPGGFLGVDLFFVLSGFLITSLLVLEWRARGRIDLPAFWARRARRLLPALLLVLVAVGLLDRFGGDGTPQATRGDVLATLAYVQNWHLLAGGTGYFEQAALPSSLQHAWSLSIEEQFYLVWPILLGALLAARGLRRAARLRLTLAVTVAGAGVSAAVMAALHPAGADPSRVYYGTDTRACSLLIGAALAVGLALRPDARPAGVLPVVLGWVGAGALVVLWARADGDSDLLYRGGMPLGEVAAALVIAAVALRPAAPLARVLAWRPLRLLGVVSYGVYLWHWPLFGLLTAARTGLHGPALLAVRLASTLLAAVVSYVLVERPLRRPAARSRRSHRAVAPRLVAVRAVPAAAVAVAVVAAAVALAPASAVPTAALAAEQGQDDDDGTVDPEHEGDAEPTGTPTRAATGTTSRSRSAQARRLLVMGDSVAKSLAAGLASYLGGASPHLTDGAVLGCGVTIGGPFHYSGQLRVQGNQCVPWEQRWRARVKAVRPDVVVLLVGRWEVMDRVFEGRWTHIGDPGYDAYLQGQLRTAIGILRSTGARVVVVTAPYYRRGEQPDGDLWAEDAPDRTDRWNTLLRATAAPAGASVVDFGGRTGPHGRYEELVDGVRLRYDGVHLREAAVRALAPWLLPRVLGPLRAPAAQPAG
jgi:peptidoglycan/LPS O-acetylase OafA/YrhL/lysophospholipase L1-like esterase